MGLPPQLPPEILEALVRGACVVTANQRAARTLRRLYDQRQHAAGISTWAPAPILAWETWTRSLWHRLVLSGQATALLLNRTQELALWRSILASDVELRTLRQPEALATLAFDAWSSLHAHRHTGPLTGAAESTDEAAFRRWSTSLRQRCRRDALLTSAELDAALERAVVDRTLQLSQTALILVGFDERSPSQQALIDAISRSGVAVSDYTPRTAAGEFLCCATDTAREELEACALWMRQQLAREPTGRLAIIVPSLDGDRAELERVLRDTLAPELHNIELRTAPPPFEFSLGVPLSSTASVAAALDLLTWSQQAVPTSTVSRLLLSRYLAGGTFATERLARAALDAARARSHNLRPELTLDEALRQISTANPAPPRLRHTLRAFRHAAEPLQDTAERTYLEWTERIRAALDAADWIPAAETSFEYQVRERWQSALDELATLDFTGQPVSFSQALEDLKRLSANTIFAPEAHGAPIQILGPLEAAGSTFDAIWVLRCGDLTFPAPAVTNPLLPWRLRRAFRLPGSGAAEDTARARTLLRRIVASAPRVVVSHARHLDQGAQKLAAVARELGPTEFSAISLEAAAEPPAITLVAVMEQMPLPPPPDRVLRGGAALLEAQAACGFRAFAQFRLGSKPLEDAAFGLHARARGEVVHQILEDFWAEVRTQTALRQLSRDERRDRLDQHITSALSRWSAASTKAWDRAYLDVQRTCLRAVLLDWMDEELRREPFEVRFREQSHEELAVGPTRLRVRVDRIDYTESGGAVLIDYKTGLSTPKQWLSDRPDAPQLPLYALLPEAERLDAVAFAIIRSGRDLGFAGFEARPNVIPGASKLPAEDLAELQQQWRVTLDRLASDFHAGDTRVRPKNFPKTCTFCAQRLLCRLDPNTLIEQLAEEIDATEDAERG